MLEIIALIFLTRKIGDIATRKGLKPGMWKLYTVLVWFGMEFMGGMIGMLIFDDLIMALLLAIPCAIGGYHIVKTILDKKPDMMEDFQDIGEQLES